MELKNGRMSWIWTAVTVLMVDQRAGEMSGCRQRMAECLWWERCMFEVVRLRTVCNRRREWCRRLVSM
jgi:hypothetical protein